jgi:hypothetical protein
MNNKNMMSRFGIASLAFGLLAMAGAAQAQNVTNNLKLTVAPEASLTITSASDTLLATSGGTFGLPFTGTTTFSYKIRTATTSGTGQIQLKVTTDFGSGGPSVANPAQGDALTYTCLATVKTGTATPCTGSLQPSTTGQTNVVSFGASTRSAQGGDSGSVAWTLPNDPQYLDGTYTAVVTYTISAT